MKDFLFGKLKTYLILTDYGEFKIGGRAYTYRGGILTVKDCFTKVATFVKINHISKSEPLFKQENKLLFCCSKNIKFQAEHLLILLY